MSPGDGLRTTACGPATVKRSGHGSWKGNPEAPSVLLLHGNKGSRANSLKRAEFLAQAGYAVLMISFRAHGDSTGEFNDVGYSARQDVVAGVEFLEKKRPGHSIVVMGVSLGSAAAIFASAELGHRVRGYILESPYQDSEDRRLEQDRDVSAPGARAGWLRGAQAGRSGLLAVHG